MFSLALNEPNSSRRWKVRPTPSRARVWGRRAVISRPSMLTWPRFGRWNPVTTLNRVVLPAPLGPMRPVTAPALDSSETPPRACTPPKLTLTSSTRNTGRLLHHVGGCGGVRLTWARGPPVPPALEGCLATHHAARVTADADGLKRYGPEHEAARGGHEGLDHRDAGVRQRRDEH